MEDNKSKILNILDKITKYKYIILAVILILTVGLILLFNNVGTPNNNTINYLVLYGEEKVTIYKNSDFVDPGYYAYDDNDNDVSGEVKVNSNLDTAKIGTYEIKYKIGNVVRIRKVNVIEQKTNEYKIVLNQEKEDSIIYLRKGEQYKEPGYKVFNYMNEDVTKSVEVEIDGEVNTDKVGQYTLVYKLKHESGMAVYRKIVVLDVKLNLTLSTNEYVNDKVIVTIDVEGDFDYILLPTNEQVKQKSYQFVATKNGEYEFKVYNKYGMYDENKIKISNIDTTLPMGTCKGSYKDNQTTITISATDSVSGIGKYIVDGKEYTTREITISKKLTSLTVDVYDKAGNAKKISCELSSDASGITLTKNTSNYVKDKVTITVTVTGDNFSYMLLPNGVKTNNKQYDYIVTSNGVYKFKVYDKDGTYKEKIITISNIDTTSPQGTCKGGYRDNQTTIIISATDSVSGIGKYIVDSKEYTKGEITLSKKLTSLAVTVYDKAGNYKTINCELNNNETLLSLTKNTESYVNTQVMITATVTGDNFSYLLLPDGVKTNNKQYNYSVTSNGTYTFKVYDKDGTYKEKSITVSNIDKLKPTAWCMGAYDENITMIQVVFPEDEGSGIADTFKVGGKDYKYSDGTITLNQKLTALDVTIFDKAGNTNVISCDLTDNTKLPMFDKNTTFTYEYVTKTKDDNGNAIFPYGILKPSTASKSKKLPLIIWLHGAGENSVISTNFGNNGMLGVVRNWKLTNFNAYVVSPHSTEGWYNGATTEPNSAKEVRIKNKFKNFLEQIKKDYNIDEDKIILAGASAGTRGFYTIIGIDEVYLNNFSAFAYVSGYSSLIRSTSDYDKKIMNIMKAKPAIGYVGSNDDSTVIKHMKDILFKTYYKKSSDKLVTITGATHHTITSKAFNHDANEDGKSDLIEWMLSQ